MESCELSPNLRSLAALINILSPYSSASLSACIRLKYTVALTSQTDYLYGVANVVIWGFAENGIGMMVGNIATLRPLFRILRDGRTSDYNKSPGYGSRSGGAMFSRNYELESGKNLNHTTAEVDHGPRGSSSDGDSQKDILENGQRPGQADILVNRQVMVTYD